MPWKEICVADQRVRFIADWLSGGYGKSGLCARYGISRPTGDKWLSRYAAEGLDGLRDRSRAPHGHPTAVPEWCCEEIIATKLRFPDFGPKKVMDWLRRVSPQTSWPADSTAGEILRKTGLVRPRSYRRHVAAYSEPFVACQSPNMNWSADFKGDFVLGNAQRCYPLTISDNYSRYLLACQALTRTHFGAVQPWFEWVFREYGLPEAIRTDNGSPFASLAVGGLTRLSMWWIQLGIRPERIKPGRPSQNGRHERMHRSLSDGVTPIQPTPLAQQQQFDRWRQIYNWERSHEALGRRVPGDVHCRSSRSYPTRLSPIEYDQGTIVRQVRHNGEFKWKGERIYLTEVLAHEPVGLSQLTDDRWEIRYSFHLLGYLDDRTKTVLKPTDWHGKQ
jgi:transposase InsO family protein